jgi:hypothetical protein
MTEESERLWKEMVVTELAVALRHLPGGTEQNSKKHRSQYVASEVFTEVVTWSFIFWDVTPCIPLKFYLRFGGKHRLHLHERKPIL